MRHVNLKNKGIIQLNWYTGFYLFAMVFKEVVLGFSSLALYNSDIIKTYLVFFFHLTIV